MAKSGPPFWYPCPPPLTEGLQKFGNHVRIDRGIATSMFALYHLKLILAAGEDVNANRENEGSSGIGNAKHHGGINW